MKAAGIQRGAMEYEKEIAGYITRKHVYEIAKLKSEDTLWQMVDLKVICEKVIDMAYCCGVHVSASDKIIEPTSPSVESSANS